MHGTAKPLALALYLSPELAGWRVGISLHCAHLLPGFVCCLGWLTKDNININAAFISLVLLTFKRSECVIYTGQSRPFLTFQRNTSIYLKGDEDRIALYCEFNISIRAFLT